MTNHQTNVSAIAIARAHWGNALPSWVKLLAEYSDAHTQLAAAKKIGRSASLVNQVLKNKYPGDLNAVQTRVETAFNKAQVACPILGLIEGADCLKHQAEPYSPSNHVKVALFRQCRRCPHANHTSQS